MKPLVYILIFGFIFWGSSIALADVLPVPTINVNPDLYYPFDEILYLEGRAKPNSTVEIRFQKSGAKPIRLVAKSDQNGEWVYADRVPLEAGNWEVRTRVVMGDSTSEWSNPRIIKAIATGLVIGGVTVKFSFMVFFLILAVAVIAYLVFRLRQEAREKAGIEIEQDFYELKRSIQEELKHLDKKHNLSKEDEAHREKLMRDLEHIEREIERKLKNL